MIMDRWLSNDFAQNHVRQRDQRLLRRGATHHQGSRSLPAYKQAYEAAHPGMEVSEFSAWAMSHMGRASSSVSFDPSTPREVYSDPTMHTKVQEYISKVREVHGEDYDVRTEPIDAETIMRLGGGKKHGRLWIADGAIDSTTVPSLDVLRARSTSSSQPIRPRPTPSLQRVNALEAELQAQKLVVEAKSAQLQAQREAFAAQERRMQEMEAFMRSVQQGGVPLPLAAPPPPTSTATLLRRRVRITPLMRHRMMEPLLHHRVIGRLFEELCFVMCLDLSFTCGCDLCFDLMDCGCEFVTCGCDI